jgi:enamine deaminase RidA (YjgF/YER057c/UK114 family)
LVKSTGTFVKTEIQMLLRREEDRIMATIIQKLKEMGYSLPDPWPPGKLERAVQSGSLVFTSGAGSLVKGKLGQDLDIETGYRAARECCLQLLANLKTVIGSLGNVHRVVKLLCMVNSTPDFIDQPAVANGCTDLLIGLYGEKAGKHARSAVGMSSLPGGIAVEIEMIVETVS